MYDMAYMIPYNQSEIRLQRRKMKIPESHMIHCAKMCKNAKIIIKQWVQNRLFQESNLICGVFGAVSSHKVPALRILG